MSALSSPKYETSKVGLAPVVQSHYNRIGNESSRDRERSRVFHLRSLNNWIKSVLIHKYIAKCKEDMSEDAPFHVLDLGAGKGGDLIKWEKGGISYLICADIAETSLKHAEKRYRELKKRHRRQSEAGRIFEAEFIAADLTRVCLKELFKNPSMKLNLVSCQFAIHYSFETLSQARCMLRNAAECLVPGGYFIGTTTDANELVRRVREAPGLQFGNDVFRIEFNGSKENFPLFGARYEFHLEGVVDCPEFLVNFDVLEELAKEFDLKLVYKERSQDFFERFKNDPEGKALLKKMKALEAYPAYGDQTLMGKPSDYEHAEKELNNILALLPTLPRRPQVGTISKPEWEALGIYLVFAFQKTSPPASK